MIKIFLLSLFFSISSFFSFGQDVLKYGQAIRHADSLHQVKNHLRASEVYSNAFSLKVPSSFKDNSRYNAAISWAIVGEADSALVQLFYLAEGDYHYMYIDDIKSDTSFNSLHKSKNWRKLLHIIKRNKKEYESGLDHNIIKFIDSIQNADQKYRWAIDSLEIKHGIESQEVKDCWKKIEYIDSSNQVALKKLLNDHGWPSPFQIGYHGRFQLIIMMQHVDVEMQMAYYPMMKKAIENGLLPASFIALIEDRIAINQGNEQIYGTQWCRNLKTNEWYVCPIIDPENVNLRRAEIGMGLIEEGFYNSNWKFKEYLERLPELKLIWERDKDKTKE